VSAAEAVYGTQLVLPGQFVNSPAARQQLVEEGKAALAGFGPTPTQHAGVSQQLPSTPPEQLMLAEYVLVRRDGAKSPLDRPYDGPYRVLQRSAQFFKLQVGSTQQVVSTARLKPVISSEDVLVGLPRVSGRPKKCVSFSLPS
jgi:cleavage and polyadenylation specificity factor subunit 1